MTPRTVFRSFCIERQSCVLYAIVLLVAALTITLFWLNEARRNERILEQMIELESRLLEADTQQLDATLVSGLRALDSVSHVLEDDPSPEVRNGLLESLLRDSEVVLQARLIGLDGVERVRFDQTGEEIRRLADEQLQDKSARPYVTALRALNTGQFYVSRIDLNEEKGVIQTPFQPTIRLGRRLVDELGMLVINLDLTQLIEEATQQYSESTHTWLVDATGDWLAGPAPELEWGFQLGERHGLADRFSREVADALLASHQSNFAKVLPDRSVVIAVHLDPAQTLYPSSVLSRDTNPVFVRLFEPAYISSVTSDYQTVSPWTVTIGCLLVTAILIVLINRLQSRRDAQQRYELMEGETKLMRGIAVFLPQMAYTCNADGLNTFLSPRWSEFVGSPIDRLIDRVPSFVHPDDRPQVEAAWRDALRTGEPFGVQFRLRRYDGVYRTVSTSAIPIKDESGNVDQWFGSTWDIQDSVDLKRALEDANERLEIALRERSADNQALLDRLEIALDAGHIGTWQYDVALQTSLWDERMYEMYGLARRSGPQPHDIADSLIHPLDFASVRATADRAISTGTQQDVEYRALLEDGSERWFFSAARPVVDEQGEVVRLIGCNVDITSLKENEALQIEARQAAEVAAQSKAAFLANMSHEIRTPMNAVLGMLSLLRDDARDDRQLADLERAYSSANRLLGILNDILDLSRVDSGNFSLTPANFTLEELIGSSVELFATTAEQKGVRLAVDVDPSVPSEMIGDLLRLGQVISNLVGNAVKFTQAGEQVTLRLESPYTDDECVQLKVSVIDTGIGMNEEQQQRVFQAFEQADNSTSRRFGGTGLGLAISQKLVNLMGGALSVESELGKGATFSFTVELASTPNAARFNMPMKSQAPSQPMQVTDDYTGIRVLSVDDMEINNEVASRLLSTYGFQVDCVESGIAAVEAIQQKTYDLVLMDVHMDGMNGLEAVRCIRQLKNIEQPLVFGLSASVTQTDREAGFEAGMDQYLTKPFKVTELFAALSASGLKPRKVRTQEVAVEEPPTPQVPDELRGLPIFIDPDGALARMGGQPSLFISAIKSFVQALPVLKSGYVKALSVSDTETARNLMHRLKGSALLIADAQLAALAAEREQLHEDGSMGDEQEILAVVDAHCSALRSFLEGLSGKKEGPAVEDGEFDTLLTEIREDLARSRAPRKVRMGLLIEGLRQRGHGSQADAFTSAMAVFELKKALEVIAEVER